MKAPHHGQRRSARRRWSTALLAMGITVATAAFFLTTWPGRIGLAVLTIAALVAMRLAWREVSQVTLDGHAALLAQHERDAEVQRVERQQAEQVSTLLKGRAQTLAQELEHVRGELLVQTRELALAQRSMSELRGSLAATQDERDQLQANVDRLNERVDELTTELSKAPDEQESEPDVLALPRRVRRGQTEVDQVWETDEMPSVSDLVTEDRASSAPALRQQEA